MASNSKTNGQYDSDWARAPPEGTTCSRLLKGIYDPKEKAFLGRTAKRWGIVLVFYAVFYAVLALLFAICMGALLLTIDETRPKYTLENSIIGANPGVAYRPLPTDGVTVYVDRANESYSEVYTRQLAQFLTPYPESANPECTTADNFGYPDTPCFFIKLNKIFDWKPEVYSDPEPDMPKDLVDFIQSLPAGVQRQKVWISCWEENGNTTNITYPWGRGLPSTYYPYVKVDNYRSPLVAVKVAPTVNSPTAVRCRAWAKNVQYNKSMKEPSGYTRFVLHVRETTATDEAAN